MEKPDVSFKSELVLDELGNGLMRVNLGVGGMEETKLLAIDDYLTLLGDATFSNVKNHIRIGCLPDGFYDGSIASDDPSSFEIVLIKEAQKKAMTYGGRHWYIPFPRLVFYLSVSKGKITDRYCYAIKKDTTNEDTPVYLYPFGNVSPDGSICMGNVITNKLENISMAEKFIADFFMSETSNDYYDKKNQTGLSQSELLYRLKDKEEFPEEWLTQVGTMKDVLKKIKCKK